MRVGSSSRPMFTAPTGKGRAEWKAPYNIPNAGQVIEISTNFATSVKPSTHSSADWNEAVFGSFSGGTVVEDYSIGGAWVTAGTGGHNHSPNLGACIFDFADATWKRLDNANGVAQQNTDYDASELTSGEITVASPGEMPAPAHIYAHCHQLRPSQGGGPKGSFMRLRGLSAAIDSSTGSGRAHAIDLSTGLWRRVTSGSYVSSVDSRISVYDAVTQRFLQVQNNLSTGVPLQYVDETDWTWKEDSIANPGVIGSTFGAFIDQQFRLLVMATSNETLYAVDADNVAAVTELTLSGSLANSSEQYQWTYYPADGCYYRFSGLTTTTAIEKLTPPAFGTDPLTEDWTVSTVNVGTALTQQPAAYITGGSIHHNRFFFVPRLNCFCWIPGGDEPVVLLKPPA